MCLLRDLSLGVQNRADVEMLTRRHEFIKLKVLFFENGCICINYQNL